MLDPRLPAHILWPLFVAALKGRFMMDQRTKFFLEAFAQVLAWAQQTQQYQQLLDLVEAWIENTIPEHVLEPRLAQFLVDLGERLKTAGPNRKA